MKRFIELTLDTGELFEVDPMLLDCIEKIADEKGPGVAADSEFTFDPEKGIVLAEFVGRLIELDLNFSLVHVTDNEVPILGSQGTCGCPDGEEGDEGIPEIPYDE